MEQNLSISQTVMHERLDGEVVALDMATGRYFSMSGPAADVWHLVSTGCEPSVWSVELSTVYMTTNEFVGIDDFVSKLLDAGLLKLTGDQTVKSDYDRLPLDHSRQRWTSPELFSYDDLSDLILIDPVHDTTDDGWPTRH